LLSFSILSKELNLGKFLFNVILDFQFDDNAPYGFDDTDYVACYNFSYPTANENQTQEPAQPEVQPVQAPQVQPVPAPEQAGVQPEVAALPQWSPQPEAVNGSGAVGEFREETFTNDMYYGAVSDDASMSGSNSGLSREATIGVGVGVSVGAITLVGVLALALYMYRKRANASADVAVTTNTPVSQL